MCQRKSGVAVRCEGGVRIYTLLGEDSHTKIREAHHIRDDGSLAASRQTPVEYVVRRDIRDTKDWEFKFDDARPDWWTDAMTESAKRQLASAAEADWDGDVLKYSGNLNLRSLTSLPKGVTLKAGGYLGLDSLTSLSEGVTLEAGGDLDLDSLTSLPKGVALKAKQIYNNGKWYKTISGLRGALK